MKRIFDPISINGQITLKNRIARSATVDGICFGGHITADVCKIYRELAEGGAGMIITGQTEVSPTGRTIPSVADAHHGGFVGELSAVSEAVHAADGVLIVQLNHSGLKSRHLENPLLGPSPCEPAPGVIARAMTKEEIRRVTSEFADAALRCKKAGADGVQIHNAHGYLLCSFFGPYTNRRGDEYGGSAENRARFVSEVYDAVRTAAGDDFIVGIKTNCTDFIEPSITLGDCIMLCRELEKRGLDFVEISGGLLPGGKAPDSFLPPKQDASDPIFYRATAKIAEAVGIPVFGVNGYRSPELIERCLNESRIEGISMCRPFIREPGLVSRWKSGDRSPAKCISCDACESATNWVQKCLPHPEKMKTLFWFGCPVERGYPRTAPPREKNKEEFEESYER